MDISVCRVTFAGVQYREREGFHWVADFSVTLNAYFFWKILSKFVVGVRKWQDETIRQRYTTAPRRDDFYRSVFVCLSLYDFVACVRFVLRSTWCRGEPLSKLNFQKSDCPSHYREWPHWMFVCVYTRVIPWQTPYLVTFSKYVVYLPRRNCIWLR